MRFLLSQEKQEKSPLQSDRALLPDASFSFCVRAEILIGNTTGAVTVKLP